MVASQLIREARLRAGLSQRELGARVGSAGSQIARWEVGASEPGFATVRAVLRACGYDFSDRLDYWSDEFRTELRENLRRSPAERLARAIKRGRSEGLAADPIEILGTLQTGAVGFTLIGGLAATIRGAERLSLGVDIAPSLDLDSLGRLDDALEELGGKPISHMLLRHALASRAVETRHGIVRIVPMPAGTLLHDSHLKRLATSEHLGSGVVPLVAQTADLALISATAGVPESDARMRELRRLAELEVGSPL